MNYAHSSDEVPEERWQKLLAHLMQVAELARQHGGEFGAAAASHAIGLWHDLGKYSAKFQRRLRGEKVQVDHSTAGAQEIMRLTGADRLMGELLAYCIAGHHTGLPDRSGADESALGARLKKTIEPLDPIWRSEIEAGAPPALPDFHWIRKDPPRFAFQLAMLGRMLFSCLIDADRGNTASFERSITGEGPEQDWPALGDIVDTLIARLQAHLAKVAADALARGKSKVEVEVNARRAAILAHAISRAGDKPGLFSLTVPTGGGKTLASLAFALAHAREHRLRRIVYAIPFTSIIDQTVQVFRQAVERPEEDGGEIILEHHSAIEEERELRALDKKGCFEGKHRLRLAMENWAAPIVVTTNVQLFESLFANRPSRCRKLHNLANSVIILDEAQTIPRHVLLPCIAALKELALNYGCTIVLCTATQPALRAGEAEDNFEGGFEGVRELAPDPHVLHDALKRVTLKNGGAMSDGDLVAALRDTPQGLVIVNTRKHALALYNAARDAGLEGCVHLTTRQYAAHRRAILADVRERLTPSDGGPPKPCRMIATSLVEAGVDLDFPKVWRAEAGLEQIWQAAGRCNREGRRAREESIVTVFASPDNPPPAVIKDLAGATEVIREKFPNLLSFDALLDYFQEIYFRMGREGLDRIKIPDRNGQKVPAKVLDRFIVDGTGTKFSYRTVGEAFHLIESGMTPVIVVRPGDSEKAHDALRELRHNPNASAGRIARDLQAYTVQVPPKARALLIANGHARFENADRFGDQFAVLQTPGLYTDETGLIWENAAYLGIEGVL